MPQEGVSFLGHRDILRYEEILRIVQAAVRVGILKARITGGEPLVRRGVIDFLKSLGEIPGLQDISLTTNGILLENYARELFRAGIRRINVSLDSLNAEKYMSITRGGEIERVIRGIEKSYETGFSPIKINVVVIKGFNDDEITDFAQLTVDKPYQVRFIEFMPIGEAAHQNGFQHFSNDLVLDRIKNFHPLEAIGSNGGKTGGPAKIYKIKGAKGEIGLISAMSHQFCGSCNRLRLTASGRLRACLLSDEELDLKTPLRAGCGDQELQELIGRAILNKPKNAPADYYETRRKKCVRNMSSIGG
jgi:cyclic pyranopterin phosphate synthase